MDNRFRFYTLVAVFLLQKAENARDKKAVS